MKVTVQVTLEDMRQAEAGECFRCAVARALQRATGDSEANVYEDDFNVRLEAHGRSIVAPVAVRLFVWALDDLDRDEHGRPVLEFPLEEELLPPTFVLPDYSDPDWRERCARCGGYVQAGELDDEGHCSECR